MFEVHLALIHHPVFNRQKKTVSTTITHFDVHDIARICRSYGVHKYHIVHPSEAQLMFVERLKEHWLVGSGKALNPIRSEAFKIIETSQSLDILRKNYNFDLVLATSAKEHPKFEKFTFLGLKKSIQEMKVGSKPYKLLLIFGTGSGLTPECLEHCDGLIEPIVGFEGSDFRHLSVRAAVAIVLDRLIAP
jgi:hypothetical protein